MDEVERRAMNVVQGLKNGDKFDWEYEGFDDEGNAICGAWVSWIKEHGGLIDEG
jgi:hypothetical protein